MTKKSQIPEEWSDAEGWAWGEIRAGRIADFHRLYDQKLDPKKLDGWDDKKKDRKLSLEFLVTILTEESFRSVTPFKGVSISGGYFDETIDLQHTRVEQKLWLEHCRFNSTLSLMNLHVSGWFSLEGSWAGGAIDLSGSVIDSHVSLKLVKIVNQVDLTAARIGGQLVMDGSSFSGALIMNGTEVGQYLLMRDKESFKKVDLTGAKISGQVDMSGSSFDGMLIMNGTEVGQHVLMRDKASFKEVDLTAAKIGGQLIMDGSSFGAKLTMAGIEVDQHLFMSDKASFKEVDLTAAKIGGQLVMDGSTFGGKLTMGGIEVGQDLFARSTTFPKDQEIALFFSKIGSNLNLSDATIGAIDLTSTTITGEMCLGSAKSRKPTNWVGASRMVLRNTTANTFQDADVSMDSWPSNLVLDGFSYRRFGGHGAEGFADIANRDTNWFIEWLKRDKPFSPSPYSQLANVLTEIGYPAKANTIRFAARNRSRSEAWKQREWLRWIRLTLLQYTIGYGLGARYFRVLWWFGGITLIGFLVLLGSIEKSNWDIFQMVWASFDQVLPIVKLNEGHEKFVLGNCSGWAIAYFYFQKLIGYVLGGFLGAGLAGLTQKS